jgi:hypothetical protein
MRLARVALLAGILVSSTACFQMTTVLRIYGDGAGWIDHRMMFSTAALAQLRQLAAFTGGRGQAVFDPLSEQQARDLAGVIGHGVTYVQSQAIVEPNGQGREATYSFIDIDQLKISTQPATPQGASPPGLDGGEMVTFSLAHEPGGSAVLRIQVPEPNWIGSIGTLNASGQLALLKTVLAGARIVLAVEPAGAIVRTSSPYVNDQRVTLLEVDLDEILKDETLVPRLTAAKTQEEVMAIMRTAAGLKINLDREITIEFTPSKR